MLDNLPAIDPSFKYLGALRIAVLVAFGAAVYWFTRRMAFNQGYAAGEYYTVEAVRERMKGQSHENE